MAEYTITSEDVKNAKEVLRALIRANNPNIDVTEGSILSDLLVDGHATIFAYLSALISNERARQSLLTLRNLPESEGVADAADALLSNLFFTRSQGQFARGVITLYFSRRKDVLVPRNARFFKTPSHVFYVDSSTDVFIPAADLRPYIDGTGIVAGYTANIFIVAARTGSDYNFPPGRFVAFDQFDPYLTLVENPRAIQNGESVQSTQAFIERSAKAMSLRALINARSNASTLLDKFPNVQDVITVGMGDPEMRRDMIRVAGATNLHVGGHMDVFVRLPVQEVSERLKLGQAQQRNDNRAVILRDTGTTPSGSFITAGVKVGDILRILNGIPEAPADFRIVAVKPTELEVSTDACFSVATDTLNPPGTLSYSIGNNYPDFNNRAVVLNSAAAKTSAVFSVYNAVQLAPGPIYAVKRVEILPPLPPQLLPFADPATGGVVLTKRRMTPAGRDPHPGEEPSYRIYVLNPKEGNSALAVHLLDVGWPSVDLSDVTVEVTYDTVSDFAAVHTYTRITDRTSCSDTLCRSLYGVYVSGIVPYRQRTAPAGSVATVPVFDPIAASKAVVSFIRTYKSADPLDVNTLLTVARDTSEGASVFSTALMRYVLYLPDGRYIEYASEDVLTILPDGVTSSARVINLTDLGLPTSGYYPALRMLLQNLGVSERLIRYFAEDGAIVFERRN